MCLTKKSVIEVISHTHFNVHNFVMSAVPRFDHAAGHGYVIVLLANVLVRLVANDRQTTHNCRQRRRMESKMQVLCVCVRVRACVCDCWQGCSS